MEVKDGRNFNPTKCDDMLRSGALMPTYIVQVKKTKMIDEANGDTILCLGDNILRGVK